MKYILAGVASHRPKKSREKKKRKEKRSKNKMKERKSACELRRVKCVGGDFGGLFGVP